MEFVAKLAGKADKLLNYLICIVLCLALLFGGYSLWDTYNLYSRASVSDELLNLKPSGEEGNLSLLELQAINPDICAWLTVTGTNIDYPVVHGQNNFDYVNTDYYGEFSVSGSIFLDYRNSAEFTDDYSIIYGHHMDAGAMFGDVASFENADVFDSYTTGQLFLPDKTFILDIFAFMSVDAYDEIMCNTIVSGDRKTQMLDYIKENAVNYRDIGVTVQDRLVSLYTCSSAFTNARSMIVARLTEI